ncbi:TetR/AcrR family transcriptional regulator [Spongiactinospora sp. TRM90649]|uniref:TetR/AcrR family transcriptional regulator n=1 Tax=Spongiactinospora sp. TRM90649 TaxID=3031114 RepID=UPI0023F6A514|nr:TetR/AcrR family transcriptional regulator [Spongiactinospora sp. TRM90649]MDF5755652.1 TetR/AcrR family transcriptional regulator [Spongiactinospora sp. TRM90649]
MTTHGTAEGTVRTAGRPRSAKAERAIIEAALDLMGEGMTVSELTIEAIATRAGVGKTTIYRRWSNKEDLVVDALATLKAPIPPLPGTSVRDDLVVYLRTVQREAADPRNRCVMNIAMSESDRHPRLAARVREVTIEPRRAVLRGVLSRGMATGELRPDLHLEIAMASVVGTMMWYTKWLTEQDAALDDIAETVTDELLVGLRAA